MKCPYFHEPSGCSGDPYIPSRDHCPYRGDNTKSPKCDIALKCKFYVRPGTDYCDNPDGQATCPCEGDSGKCPYPAGDR